MMMIKVLWVSVGTPKISYVITLDRVYEFKLVVIKDWVSAFEAFLFC